MCTRDVYVKRMHIKTFIHTIWSILISLDISLTWLTNLPWHVGYVERAFCNSLYFHLLSTRLFVKSPGRCTIGMVQHRTCQRFLSRCSPQRLQLWLLFLMCLQLPALHFQSTPAICTSSPPPCQILPLDSNIRCRLPGTLMHDENQRSTDDRAAAGSSPCGELSPLSSPHTCLTLCHLASDLLRGTNYYLALEATNEVVL